MDAPLLLWSYGVSDLESNGQQYIAHIVAYLCCRIGAVAQPVGKMDIPVHCMYIGQVDKEPPMPVPEAAAEVYTSSFFPIDIFIWIAVIGCTKTYHYGSKFQLTAHAEIKCALIGLVDGFIELFQIVLGPLVGKCVLILIGTE